MTIEEMSNPELKKKMLLLSCKPTKTKGKNQELSQSA